MNKWWIGLATLCACTFAQADDSNWRLFAAVGMATGGDTIIAGTITNTTTNTVERYDIRAGTGTRYRVGAEYRLLGRFTLQGSIGRSVSDPMGVNGSLTFTTTPTELLAFVNLTDGLRVGGGVRQTSAEMTGTGVAARSPVVGTYTSTQGSVVEFQYLFSADNSNAGYKKTQVGIAFRLVQESFTHNALTFNGDHRELSLVLYF